MLNLKDTAAVAELLSRRAATGLLSMSRNLQKLVRSQVRSADVAIGSLAYPATQGAPGRVATWLAQLTPW